jgi:hypothetical protein
MNIKKLNKQRREDDDDDDDVVLLRFTHLRVSGPAMQTQF